MCYLAIFYVKDNIWCNVIVLYGIDNKYGDVFKLNFVCLSLLGWMCNWEELIGFFLFLVFDFFSYMIGVLLIVDGGWMVW